MTRRLTVLLGVALFCAISGAAPRPALAGGYDVYSCNQTVAGGANHSWGPVADGGMTAYTDCPARQGLVARNVYDGAASTFLQVLEHIPRDVQLLLVDDGDGDDEPSAAA
jgi:hypothetical protein